ncbi:MAG: DUF1523 family protein [Rhodobacterales bacterium]|nr:DUF1523 family protein [Rhodobacterales bacterium]NCT13401.1 DUF1523 family protein [Rhodobacterales bacterium]
MPLYVKGILWVCYLGGTFLLSGALVGAGFWRWVLWGGVGVLPVLLYSDYLKWVFWGFAWASFAAFLHYTLPQIDIVRVTDTYSKRIDFGENSIFWASEDVGTAASMSRDIFFIQGFRPNGRPVIYRNEDTGWGWPPYFKINTANLQAEANNLLSTEAAPRWVAIKHYGWRNEFLTIFPNAVSVRPVDGPDADRIPRTTIAILVVLAALIWAVWVRWRRFKAQRLDPALAGMDAALDQKRDGVSRWINSWRGKPRR